MKLNNMVKQSLYYLISGFILVIGLVMIISCGGGGGNGDGTIAYTGSTDKAAINEGNAVQLVLGAYYGGPVTEAYSKITTDEPRTTQKITETENGSCGGSMTYTINPDNITGDFTGTLHFADYCEAGETIDGIIDLSGRVDLTTLDILNMDMSFNQILFQPANSSKVYKLENYTVSMVNDVNTASVEMGYNSGRYYHPDFGYVEVVTPVAFTQFAGDLGPSSGELMITGDLLSKASLIALTPDTFEVTADTDGDGIFDWSSGTLNWSTGNIAP